MGRLRNRMIAAFLLVALLPAIPLSLVMWNLLDRSFAFRGEGTIAAALRAGMEESRETLRAAKERFEGEVRRVWAPRIAGGEIPVEPRFLPLDEGEGLFVRLVSPDANGAATGDEEALRRLGATRGRIEGNDGWVGPERVDSFLFLARREGEKTYLFRKAIDGEVERRAAVLADGIALAGALRLARGAVIRSYAIPFILVYLFLLLLAATAAALLAGRLSAPLEQLATAARRVGDGDLSVRVEMRSGGEVGDLAEAFNEMVGRLAVQRDELARLERLAAWREMARALAHEIKNPLTPIRLAVGEMSDRYGGGDERYAGLLRECVGIVDEEIEALRKLVREFSEFARFPELHAERTDIIALLLEIGRLYGEKKVALPESRSPLFAVIDRDQIRRALINLVDNGLTACRAAGRPERVRLDARPSADAVRIDVADEGCGIVESDRKRIFEPHFTTGADGMGLGLPIVEGIVRSHGGSIVVESQAGKGTVFSITLPAGPVGDSR